MLIIYIYLIHVRNFLKALTLCHSGVPYSDDNDIYRYKVFYTNHF